LGLMIIKAFHFLGKRNKIRKIAALNAFNMARERLLEVTTVPLSNDEE